MMNCPRDLNLFLLDAPLFENTFTDNECLYVKCSHCFATSICKRDKQLINAVLDKIRAEIKELDGRYVIGDYAIYDDSPRYVQLREVLQIIDKYKSESEDKE